MADVGTLSLGTYTSADGSITTTGSAPFLEVIASADDADHVSDATNSTHTSIATFELSTTPADLGNMDTLSIRLRYLRSANGANKTWDSLRARVFRADGTTALSDDVTVASAITATTATNSSVITLTGLDTAANRTVWEGAVVTIGWTVTRSKGGETDAFRVTAGELTGTYTAAVISGAATGSIAWAGTVTGEAPAAATPAAVSDLAATAGNTQAALTWTAPDDGGSAITDYVVQSRETAPDGTNQPDALYTLGTGWTTSTGVNADSWQLVDDDPDSADTADYVRHDGSAGATAIWHLSNTPAGFVSANTAAGKVRVRASLQMSGYVSGTARIRARLARNSDDVAMSDTLTLLSATNSGPAVFAGSFTLTAAALSDNNKTSIDTWYLRFDVDTNSGTTSTIYAARVYFDDYVSTWETFADGTSSATGATVTGLTNDVSYDFQVAGVNGNGTGAYSNIATATPVAASASEGSSTGSIAWAGSATGTNVRSGSATGSIDFAGTAAGASALQGSSTGSVAWAGTVTGEAPVVGASEGSATGSIAWNGSSTSSSALQGSSTGSVAWAGTVTGEAPANSGAVTGSIAFVGTATGVFPELELDAVDDLVASPGDTQATLTWTAPALAPVNGLLINVGEVAALPTTGTAWTTMLAAADGFDGDTMSNYDGQSSTHGTSALAAGLVFARNGTTSYRTEIVNAITDMTGAAYVKTNGSALGWARNMSAWIAASQLIDLEAHNATLYGDWVTFLDGMPGEAYSGDGGTSLVDLARARANNIGIIARCACAAIASYVGDATLLGEIADMHKEWMEGQTVYGFDYNTPDGGWQVDPTTLSSYIGVNRLNATRDGHNFDGILADDWRRNGAYNSADFPGTNVTKYPWAAYGAALGLSHILGRVGYPDVFSWGDNAIERAYVRLRWAFLNGTDWTWGDTAGGGSDDRWMIWMSEDKFAEGYPTPAATGHGHPFSWSDWTHG